MTAVVEPTEETTSFRSWVIGENQAHVEMEGMVADIDGQGDSLEMIIREASSNVRVVSNCSTLVLHGDEHAIETKIASTGNLIAHAYNLHGEPLSEHHAAVGIVYDSWMSEKDPNDPDYPFYVELTGQEEW